MVIPTELRFSELLLTVCYLILLPSLLFVKADIHPELFWMDIRQFEA